MPLQLRCRDKTNEHITPKTEYERTSGTNRRAQTRKYQPGRNVHLDHGRLREGQKAFLHRTLGTAPLLNRNLEHVPLLHALRIAGRRVHLSRPQATSNIQTSELAEVSVKRVKCWHIRTRSHFSVHYLYQ